MLAHALPLSSGELARLRAFTSRFVELCLELAARGIPETIQHDDLHGANIYRRDGRLRILDWGDSCVSHPFRTLYVTFEHLFLPTGNTSIEDVEISFDRRDAPLGSVIVLFFDHGEQPLKIVHLHLERL